jgi:formylglycine-generating enzyme required for sulfatase activity
MSPDWGWTRKINIIVLLEVSMANVSIGGNVTDSVLVCGNDNFVVKIGDINGGIVNIIKPSDKPKYSARPMPVAIKPRAFSALLDRENEFELIKKASQYANPVSVWGKDGVGKTTFVRYLTHTLDAGNFTSGLVYINAANLGYEDLLQALFDAFFESDISYKPATSGIIHALQNIKALIFLDDLKIGRDESASILDAAPNSLFILSSTERSLWGEGVVIPLRGLPESESLKLFEKELSRPLNEREKTTVIKICAALQGHPLQILQTAALVRDGGTPVENVLSGIVNEKAEDKSMAYMSMANLNESEKQTLAFLAAAGGNIVSLEHIKKIFKGGSGQNDIQRLVALGLVQAHSPRFSITNSLAASISATWDLSSWQDVLLIYAINWLSQQPASALVEESSGLLIHTLKTAGERQKWREVIQLGRALEKFMIFYKRWQTWADILNLILTAAKALNDRHIQAWALHQLGSRALYLGYAGDAGTFLSQALNIRQALGDKAGAAVTQHNINTLNGIVAPIKGNTSGCKKYLTYGCGGATIITILAVIGLIILSFSLPVEPPYYPPTEPPVVIRPTDASPSPISTFTVTSAPTLTPEFTGTPIPTHTPTMTLKPRLTPTQSITPTPTVFDPRPDDSDFHDASGAPMRAVPANGEFLMGSLGTSDGPNPSMPAHHVELDAFYIDKYEVTNHLYKACVDAGGCSLPMNYENMRKNDNNLPVIYVTWFQARSYCEWRGAQLPTEAQWEKSARGADGRLYPWGNDPINCSLANYGSCTQSTTEVGSYASTSPYGLYDMTGNVWEWVADWYSDTYYSESPFRNPLGPDFGSDSDGKRVLRGGSYVDDETYQTVTFRNLEFPGNTNWNIGFRCARSSAP